MKVSEIHQSLEKVTKSLLDLNQKIENETLNAKQKASLKFRIDATVDAYNYFIEMLLNQEYDEVKPDCPPNSI